MAVHGTLRSTGSVHEFAPSPPMVLRIHRSLARRMRCMFMAGLCRRSSRDSLLLYRSVFRNRSFAAFHSRQPPSSQRCSTATNCYHLPLTRLHHSALPLVSCLHPPPHPTQVARTSTQNWHLSLLRCHVRYMLFCCHTVVAPPLLSSLDSHHHCPLHCCIVAPPPPLDSC
jgi:hypothetical protein